MQPDQSERLGGGAPSCGRNRKLLLVCNQFPSIRFKILCLLHFVAESLFPPDGQTSLPVLVTKGLYLPPFYLPAAGPPCRQDGGQPSLITQRREKWNVSQQRKESDMSQSQQSVRAAKLKRERKRGKAGSSVAPHCRWAESEGRRRMCLMSFCTNPKQKGMGEKRKKWRRGEIKGWKSAEDKVEGRQEQEDEERCDEKPDRWESKTTQQDRINSRVFCERCANNLRKFQRAEILRNIVIIV